MKSKGFNEIKSVKVAIGNKEYITENQSQFNGDTKNDSIPKENKNKNCTTINSGPKVIKLFSCSTQLSMKFFMLINLKLLTMPNSFLLNIAEHENVSANKYENANNCWHFHI